MATNTGAVQFIGVSAEEFLAHTEAELKAGKWADGTEVHPQIRESLQHLTKTATAQKAKPQYYVFVWSRFIFIKITF